MNKSSKLEYDATLTRNPQTLATFEDQSRALDQLFKRLPSTSTSRPGVNPRRIRTPQCPTSSNHQKTSTSRMGLVHPKIIPLRKKRHRTKQPRRAATEPNPQTNFRTTLIHPSLAISDEKHDNENNLVREQPPSLTTFERQRSESILSYTSTSLSSPRSLMGYSGGSANFHPDHTDHGKSKLVESLEYIEKTIGAIENALEQVKGIKVGLQKHNSSSTQSSTSSSLTTYRSAESATLHCESCVNRLADDLNACKPQAKANNRLVKRSHTVIYRRRSLSPGASGSDVVDSAKGLKIPGSGEDPEKRPAVKLEASPVRRLNVPYRSMTTIPISDSRRISDSLSISSTSMSLDEESSPSSSSKIAEGSKSTPVSPRRSLTDSPVLNDSAKVAMIRSSSLLNIHSAIHTNGSRSANSSPMPRMRALGEIALRSRSPTRDVTITQTARRNRSRSSAVFFSSFWKRANQNDQLNTEEEDKRLRILFKKLKSKSNHDQAVDELFHFLQSHDTVTMASYFAKSRKSIQQNLKSELEERFYSSHELDSGNFSPKAKRHSRSQSSKGISASKNSTMFIRVRETMSKIAGSNGSIRLSRRKASDVDRSVTTVFSTHQIQKAQQQLDRLDGYTKPNPSSAPHFIDRPANLRARTSPCRDEMDAFDLLSVSENDPITSGEQIDLFTLFKKRETAGFDSVVTTQETSNNSTKCLSAPPKSRTRSLSGSRTERSKSKSKSKSKNSKKLPIRQVKLSKSVDNTSTRSDRSPIAYLSIGQQELLERRQTCSANVIIGNQFALGRYLKKPTVTHLGIFSPEQTPSKCKLGLYQDANGQPSFLIAETSEVDVTEGRISIPLEHPMRLIPNGRYWVVFVLSRDSVCSFSQQTSCMYRVFPHNFFSSLPPTLSRRGSRKYGMQFNSFVTLCHHANYM